MNFGQWVRETREARRMSQEECAARASVHQSVWSDYENRDKEGQPRKKTVEKIADALEVPHSVALKAAGFDIEDCYAMPMDKELAAIIAQLSEDKKRLGISLLRTLAISA